MSVNSPLADNWWDVKGSHLSKYGLRYNLIKCKILTFNATHILWDHRATHLPYKYDLKGTINGSWNPHLSLSQTPWQFSLSFIAEHLLFLVINHLLFYPLINPINTQSNKFKTSNNITQNYFAWLQLIWYICNDRDNHHRLNLM